ncbi:MAG: acyl-CoA dehydrogenase family protein [Anaerolineae bacterium]|jgi:acyl-CoA dehydrogenase|nr:acyl-CoA dehydrogenase family protein [Anaerolineae bacterium]
MFDFSIAPDVQALLGRVRQFVDEVVIPAEAHAHDDPLEGLPPSVLADLRAEAKRRGLYAPTMPVALGGLGLSITQFTPVLEVAGRSLIGPMALGCAAPDEGNMHLLHLYATPEQRARYLEPLVRGDIFSAFGMTEPAPGAGSDPSMLRTSARRDGDEWVIDGHKWWTTNAGVASVLIIMARTEGEGGGATLFLAPMDSAGIEIVRRVPHMGEPDFGGHAEIRLNGLRLRDSDVLGQVGQGFALVQARLGPARLTHCMRWTGIAQRGLEIAAEYVSQREAFGTTLGGHQAVQWMLADSASELHAGRLMIQHCAWLLEQGEQARQETSMCKVHVSETVCRVLDRAIQMCGGMGISRDLPLSRWYEAARAFRIYDGASEVHRMVIARQVLKQYGVPRKPR